MRDRVEFLGPGLVHESSSAPSTSRCGLWLGSGFVHSCMVCLHSRLDQRLFDFLAHVAYASARILVPYGIHFS
jgi:hypothetical protein